MTSAEWIAIAGLVGLAIYCIETRKIRKASQAQLEALRTPCLTFVCTPRAGNDAVLDSGGVRGTMQLDFDSGDAMLKNIGNGPAVNIEYKLTPLSGDVNVGARDGFVPFIPPGVRATVPIPRTALQARRYECVFRYDSLSFTRYETKLIVHNLVLVHPFKFGQALKASGKVTHSA